MKYNNRILDTIKLICDLQSEAKTSEDIADLYAWFRHVVVTALGDKDE